MPSLITYDIRAVNDEIHRAMLGASVQPVLRNAEIVAKEKNKLWEFRVLVVPQINESEIEPICQFLAEIDLTLPVCFLAFRPNFVLENHPGATLELMERAVQIAKRTGLRNVTWAGRTGLSGNAISQRDRRYATLGGQIAGAYAGVVGCSTYPRDCDVCEKSQECPIKSYNAARQT